MKAPYQISAVPRNYNSNPLLADELLAEARRQSRKRDTPRGYEIRILDDGSVLFRNTNDSRYNRLISFAEIEAASRRDFWLNPHRSLIKHVFEMWS